MVDTCAAEFESYTPYYYSTYETENEVEPTSNKKIMILVAAPTESAKVSNSITAVCTPQWLFKKLALKPSWSTPTLKPFQQITTSATDFILSLSLWKMFLNICDLEKPDGVIVQFGGQTPLNLALKLKEAGVPIVGTTPESIEDAGNRESFKAIVQELKLNQPNNAISASLDQALEAADRIGYPVVVRPSFVLRWSCDGNCLQRRRTHEILHSRC